MAVRPTACSRSVPQAQFGIPRKKIHVSWLTSVIKLSTSGRPSGFAYTVAKWAGSISRTNLRYFASIDQVINNQHSVPVLFVRHPFQNFQFSLILVLVEDTHTVSISLTSSSRATIAAGTRPPRVTAMTDRQRPGSASRQANAWHLGG